MRSRTTLGSPVGWQETPFELAEATIGDLREGMGSGHFTARRITELYLARIEALDRLGPALAHVLECNPDALEIADGLDRESKAGAPRGPLHGIPIVVKDNLATADRMETTAGSLALVGAKVPRDAFVVERLRAAGAVILGKSNLSEWANFRGRHSSSGWSARGGQGKNPYALDRTPSGSSSGTAGAVAANFCAVGIGTETDGSITSPAACNAIVGLKPTVGLVSRAGIIPIAHSQDTAGPMARTVADAAVLLSVIAGPDPLDTATIAKGARAEPDYTAFLDKGGLHGARFGVPREHFFGYSAKVDRLAESALDVLRSQGAVLIDPANIPTAGKYDDSEMEVLLFEFKADLNAYLEGLVTSPVRSLADVVAFNERHAPDELRHFGQELMVEAEKRGPLTEPGYRKALARNRRLSRRLGIDAVMRQHRLDALVAPTQDPPGLIDLVNGDPQNAGSVTSPAAVAGYPHITLPMGFVHGLPVGLSFFGRPWSEGTLIKFAYAFEQATKVRRPPSFALHAET